MVRRKKDKEEEDEGEERFQCPSCGEVMDLNSLKPVFKEQYRKPGGKVDIPFEMLIRGGWLSRTLEGMACPKCNQIVGVHTCGAKMIDG